MPMVTLIRTGKFSDYTSYTLQYADCSVLLIHGSDYTSYTLQYADCSVLLIHGNYIV